MQTSWKRYTEYASSGLEILVHSVIYREGPEGRRHSLGQFWFRGGRSPGPVCETVQGVRNPIENPRARVREGREEGERRRGEE